MVPRYGVTTLLLYGSVCPLVLLLYYLLLIIVLTGAKKPAYWRRFSIVRAPVGLLRTNLA